MAGLLYYLPGKFNTILIDKIVTICYGNLMNYKIVYAKEALKALHFVQPELAERIRDWRVFYEIRDTELVILVVDIKPRGDAYKH